MAKCILVLEDQPDQVKVLEVVFKNGDLRWRQPSMEQTPSMALSEFIRAE